LGIALGVTIGCGIQNSGIKSRTSSTQVIETNIEVKDQQILVLLNTEDSDRLSKVFDKVVIQPVDNPPAPDTVKTFNSSSEDLKIQCAAEGQPSPSKKCTVSIKRKPQASENSLQSDEATNEHMFQLRKLLDVKRLYSALNVKEWDLQGSTYKRFSTSDNKMILECILDGERSRCSVFLSNGQSDDFSD